MAISAPLLEICVPSGIFCYRNIKKYENGDKGRGTVAFAQGAKIAEAITKYNGATIDGLSNFTKKFNELSKTSKAVEYTGKAFNWATHNVNPLICASSVLKVARSDDKLRSGIEETGALAGMFAGEGLMKLNKSKVLNEKNIENLAIKLKNTKGFKKICEYLLKEGNSSKYAAIIRGIAFVTVSISSYSLGRKLAEGLANRTCCAYGIKSDKQILKEENKKVEEKSLIAEDKKEVDCKKSTKKPNSKTG